MSVIDALLNNAYEDTQLLIQSDALGDHFATARNVDFTFLTAVESSAQALASFVMDNQYGVPLVETVDEGFRVVVTIHMPITQQVLCSVSALMVCLAELFELEYDGWGSVVQPLH